jgi:hypothetical protein
MVMLAGTMPSAAGAAQDLIVHVEDVDGNTISDAQMVVMMPEGGFRVPLDIRPQSCPNPLNTNSRGVLPVAILGTEDFDVTEVDLASIRLEGVPPIRWNTADVGTPFEGDLCGCTEAGGDGITDLTLKFSTQDIVAAIGTNGNHGPENALLLNMWDDRVLTVTGETLDGQPIEGRDCVRVMYKTRGPHGGGNPAEADGPEVFDQKITEVSLGGGYPNPFTSRTHITYSLPGPTRVSLTIYDVAGRKMKTLVNEEMPGGRHSAYWNRTDNSGSRLPSGVYFVRLTAQGLDKAMRLIVAQ